MFKLLFKKTFVLLSLLIGITSLSFIISEQPVSAGALEQLNLFDNVSCIFPTTAAGTCADGKSAIITSVLTFLRIIASPIAVLVIVWGGYKYFQSSVSGDQAQGLQAVRAGVIGLVLVLISPAIVSILTQTINVTQTGTGPDTVNNLELETGEITKNIVRIVQFMIFLAGSIAVFFLVYGGYKLMIASRGGASQDNVDGWKIIRNALIGLLIVLLATSIVQIVQNLVVSG